MYYSPTDRGFEQTIGERLRQWRERADMPSGAEPNSASAPTAPEAAAPDGIMPGSAVQAVPTPSGEAGEGRRVAQSEPPAGEGQPQPGKEVADQKGAAPKAARPRGAPRSAAKSADDKKE